jgi:PhnB protein
VSDIQPELWVEHPSEAIAFYQAAFGVVVAHRVGGSEDIVAQLAVGNARFWIANADAENGRFHPAALGGGTSRTLLVVDDPDAVVEAASGAGATVTSPVSDEHGWRLGRITDPGGHRWEIGKPTGPWPPRNQAGWPECGSP